LELAPPIIKENPTRKAERERNKVNGSIPQMTRTTHHKIIKKA
jgi:hypothetical protein